MPAADRENETVVRRIFDAFSRRDPFALRGLFAADAVWTVPGDGVMAGVYRGPDAIFRFLARLPKETDGTYRSQLVDVLASESRAAALYRALANPYLDAYLRGRRQALYPAGLIGRRRVDVDPLEDMQVAHRLMDGHGSSLCPRRAPTARPGPAATPVARAQPESPGLTTVNRGTTEG